MSKAFVKEDEGNPEETQEPSDPSPAGGPSDRITVEGRAALQRERDHLWSVERPHMTEEVAAAAAQGDRSDNAEYLYGKKRLREIDRRLRFLDRRLATVRVARLQPDPQGRIVFGSWFTILDEDGRESTYRIVGTDETDPRAGSISEKSPLARALLGKMAGDVAVVRRPAGELEVEVLHVRYAPT